VTALRNTGCALALYLLLAPLGTWAAPHMPPEILRLEQQWAAIKYELPKQQRQEALKQLLAEAEGVVAAKPGKAEALIWQAIIMHNYAAEKRGMGALKMVKHCRDMLEKAEQIDPLALDGLAYVTLGMLHYKVPPWPIGFGDDEKAEEYLRKGLEISPRGLDANYFMGDFLLRQKRFGEAVEHLKRATHAPPRPEWPLADAGRKADAERLLAKTRSQMQKRPEP